MKKGAKPKRLDDVSKQSSRPREDWEFKLVKTIGLRIKADLVNHRLPVDRLAIDSETSRGTVRRIIEGSANPSIVTLDRITKALVYRDVIDFFAKLERK